MPLPALRLISTVLVLVLVAALPARAYETRAEAAWIYDMASDTVLFEKNADVPLPPASMSKLMTLNMLFEALRDGRVTRETAFSVSPRAKAMGGSTMFLDERDRPSVDDLIQRRLCCGCRGVGGQRRGFLPADDRARKGSRDDANQPRQFFRLAGA